jgi:hypothetical protein
VGWMTQNSAQNVPGLATAQIGHSTLPTQSQTMHPGLSQIQPPPNHHANQSPVPPRSGLTPHQLNANQGSPNVAINSSFPMGVQTAAQSAVPMPFPIPKEQFESRYSAFRANHGINFDPRILLVDGRTIDLYVLHALVMRAGGAQKVRRTCP